MYVRRINAPILRLSPEHPARQFIESFIECRATCIGLELPPPLGKGIDQVWWSQYDGKQWTYSSFAYTYLAFDVQLDGWLSNAVDRTESEHAMLASIPRMISLVTECRQAAIIENNQAMVAVADKVLSMLENWRNCIEARVGS